MKILLCQIYFNGDVMLVIVVFTITTVVMVVKHSVNTHITVDSEIVGCS